MPRRRFPNVAIRCSLAMGGAFNEAQANVSNGTGQAGFAGAGLRGARLPGDARPRERAPHRQLRVHDSRRRPECDSARRRRSRRGARGRRLRDLVRLAYPGFPRWTLSAGIRNLFDRDPPFSNQTQSFQVGYDPTYADPHGRLYWAGVRYALR